MLEVQYILYFYVSLYFYIFQIYIYLERSLADFSTFEWRKSSVIKSVHDRMLFSRIIRR